MAKQSPILAALAQELAPAGFRAAPARPAPSATGDALLELSLAGRLILPVCVCLVSYLMIELSRHSNLIVTVWPANAIIVAALLRHVRSIGNYATIIVGGAIGTEFAGFLAGNSFTLCLILLVANVVEVVIAVGLLGIFRITSSALTSFRGVLKFIIIAGGVTPIGSTLISATAFSATYNVNWFDVWRNWYPGHSLGLIIVTPFLVCVTSREWQAQRMGERLTEAAIMLGFFIAIGTASLAFRPTVFIVAPAILLATVRFGLIGATASTFMIALMATIVVVLGLGQPIVPGLDLPHRIFTLQMFLAITAFWALPTATLLTERDRLLLDLSKANTQLAADSERKSHLVTGLRRHLTMVEENERLRLSYELHDQAGQSLIAAILELNEIDALTSGPAHERLHLLRKKMEEMGKTLHRIAWELRPPSIDELGLCKALESYVADWGEQCGTDADFHCDAPNIDDVPAEIATTVYRVVQEALTNIVKHAQRPGSVSVIVRRLDHTLQVIVEDNGCGFDTATLGDRLATHRGLGLDGMRERLALIGGTLEVESALGAGTTLFARVGLDDERTGA